MKNKIITASLLAVSAIAALLTPQLSKRAAAKPETESSAISAADGYVLREYEGVIGVFKAGVSAPVSVIDVDTRTLPESDRAALARGIYAADEDELCRRIEDFSS